MINLKVDTSDTIRISVAMMAYIAMHAHSVPTQAIPFITIEAVSKSKRGVVELDVIEKIANNYVEYNPESLGCVNLFLKNITRNAVSR